MSDDATRRGPEKELSEAGRRDRLCDQFESAWKRCERVQIEDYLAQAPQPERSAVLRELLPLELYYRQIAGEEPDFDEYRTRFPAHERVIRVAFQMGTRLADSARDASSAPLRGVHVRCPHCHNPIELVEELVFEEITCPSCGSSFSLLGEQTKSYKIPEIKRIGHFDLIDRVGTGAFGSVWMARDTELDRTVAVKIPRKGRLDAAETEQFLHEARAAAQLNHPNIVSVHEVGREGEAVYIVSDFVKGATLSDWLTGQRFTPREAADLCTKIADALHHAHECGVIHRDLKPSNIMLDADAEPHIMDFGLAKREADEITMTLDGRVLGTPAYMSPEQARGEAHHADRRSDIYSLGAILFQLLTGELPFRGNARMLVVQIINEEPPSPRKLESRVPRDLETICLKCLQKSPDRRYQTAAELTADLRRYLNQEPIHARPVSHPERLWRWCKRNPVVSGLVSALTVAILGGSAGVTSQWIRAELKAAEAQKALQQAETNLYFNQIALADREWRANNVASAETLLDACSARVRGWEWGHLKRLCHLDLFTLRGHAGPALSVAFSPDGRRIASAGRDSTVRLWDVATGRVAFILHGHAGPAASVAFSPDGRWVASASVDQTVRIWHAATGEEGPILRGHAGPVMSVAFSPDGLRIATASRDRTVKLWQADTGNEILTLHGHERAVNSVAFSPDGHRIASGGADNAIKLWQADTGTEIVTLQGHNRPVTSVAFSPDSRRIASGSQDQTVKLWDVDTGQAVLTIRGHSAFVLSVAFSPDCEWIVTASGDETLKLWDPATGQEMLTFRGHTDHVRSVAVSPDGLRIASASDDETVKLWDQAAGQEALTLRGHTKPIWSAAFSPDGRWVVSASEDNTLKVWEPATKKEIVTLKGHTGAVHCAAFSPDGRRIVSGSVDKSVKLWDVDTGKEIFTLAGHSNAVLSVAFSPDGRQIASASGDLSIMLWDVATGKEGLVLRGHVGPVVSVTFNPDGRRIASGSYDQTVRLWDAATGEEVFILKGHTDAVLSVAFSPDSRQIASGSRDQSVRLWEAATGKEGLVLKGHAIDVRCVAFSPDGRRIASTSGERTVKLWDVATGMEAFALRGHVLEVESVAFSPDGRQIATAGGDRTVRLWDAFAWRSY